MSNGAKYLFVASMDIEPEKLDLFNEVYDTEHIPTLMKVPGVVDITRLSRQPLKLSMGGQINEIVVEGEPNFSAFYWIESPEVLTSPEWAEAIEEGRWPEHVRPYTKNRRHILLKVMDTGV
tara:strand:+ start:189 stop:551 length:363 start_codon:yes stop_codon:yes gene_type:complete